MAAARVVAALALAAGLFGCQAEGFERVELKDDGISIRALDGWGQSRERGSWVFSGAGAGLDGATIVVRTVRIPESQRDQEQRSPQQIFAATEQVIEALPGARVVGPVPDVHDRYVSARLLLSFDSRKTDARYERTHVVLVAPDRSQIVHVLHTAPAGQLEQSAGVFDEVVASVRQEG